MFLQLESSILLTIKTEILAMMLEFLLIIQFYYMFKIDISIILKTILKVYNQKNATVRNLWLRFICLHLSLTVKNWYTYVVLIEKHNIFSISYNSFTQERNMYIRLVIHAHTSEKHRICYYV